MRGFIGRIIRAAVMIALVGCGPVAAQAPDLLALQGEIARLFQAGKYGEALERAEPMLAETARRHGARSQEVARAHYFVASVLLSLGQHARAEPHFVAAIDILRAAFGAAHPQVAIVEAGLGQSLVFQGRFGEAEPIVKRAIASFEADPNGDPSILARALNTLAVLYDNQQRWAESAALMMRVVPMVEAQLGPEHPMVLSALNNLALLNQRLGRPQDAERLFRRALAGLEKGLGPDHENVAIALSNIAILRDSSGDYAEAERLLLRALAILERVFGAVHQRIALALNNLGNVIENAGRQGEAEAYYERSLENFAQSVGTEHNEYGLAAFNLAGLHLASGKLAAASRWYDVGAEVVIARSRRQAQATGAMQSAQTRLEAARSAPALANYLKAAYRRAAEAPGERDRIAARMFEIAQWLQGSQAASSIAQMAARQAKAGGPLAALVRERQDTALAWQQLDAVRTAAFALPPARRDRAAERATADELARIDQRLAVLDRRLQAEFPQYAAFAESGAVTVRDAQQLLSSREALIMMVATPAWKGLEAEAFVWVVTRDRVRWVNVPGLDPRALGETVATLRCGLDQRAWDGEAGLRCAAALATDFTMSDYERFVDSGGKQGRQLPFDVGLAHRLYKSLFGEVEDIIAGKDLVVVPHGALAQLPWQVLVTAAPATSGADADYRSVAWLGRRQPITVLPAAASLKALRQHAQPTRAGKPFVGFANPLLDGNSAVPSEARAAQSARTLVQCARLPRAARLARRGGRRAVAPLASDGGQAILAAVRTQVPLPETAEELCAVARGLGAGEADVHLGPRATERALKTLSGTGRLADYRVVHFATHATLAGEIGGGREPGLILTPPSSASDSDDGYLTASEVALLKLDADWVILSACNTAGGNDEGGEAMSGLARAFFYAGARALLVSHWAVDSAATVKLVTSAVEHLAGNARVGRAEALRLAMTDMIERGAIHEAHPAFWAPFVVLGEGAPRSAR